MGALKRKKKDIVQSVGYVGMNRKERVITKTRISVKRETKSIIKSTRDILKIGVRNKMKDIEKRVLKKQR